MRLRRRASNDDVDARASLRWTAEVGFFEQWDDPPFSVILGRTGVFDQITVVMSRHTQATVIESQGYLDATYGVTMSPYPHDPPRQRL